MIVGIMRPLASGAAGNTTCLDLPDFGRSTTTSCPTVVALCLTESRCLAKSTSSTCSPAISPHLSPHRPKHEHHRPPVAGFVGEPEQLFDGEVRVLLALLAWRLDAVARVGWDESVGRGVGADAAQDSEVAQYDGGAPAFGLPADPFLDFGAGQ